MFVSELAVYSKKRIGSKKDVTATLYDNLSPSHLTPALSLLSLTKKHPPIPNAIDAAKGLGKS